MAKGKTIRVSDDELLALQAYREAAKAGPADTSNAATTAKQSVISESQQALADAFVQAIERTRPPEKKTVGNRKADTPWHPSNSPNPRPKMKRKMYHHGMALSDRIYDREIELLNQVRPGIYCDGFVRVTLRKDRGLDIDYPIATASQRLKMVNQFGVRSFTELLERLIDERRTPTKYRKAEDADLYDLDE